jgi:hypothetical protein
LAPRSRAKWSHVPAPQPTHWPSRTRHWSHHWLPVDRKRTKRFPDAGLLPVDDLEAEANVISWMSFIAATLHPARRRGIEQALRVYGVADRRLGKRTWVSERYSIAGIHLFRLYWRFSNSLHPARDDFPNLDVHYERMTDRPAVRKACDIDFCIGRIRGSESPCFCYECLVAASAEVARERLCPPRHAA